MRTGRASGYLWMPEGSQPATIPTGDLARHWGVTPGYLRMQRSKGAKAPLPAFTDLGSDHPDRFTLADEWRRVNLPPRRLRVARHDPAADTPDGKQDAAGGGREIDFDAERAKIGGDFEDWAIAEAERAAIAAAHAHREACRSGSDTKVANTLANLNEAMRRAREQRERWLDLREKSKTLISVDRAQTLIGDVLNALERQLKAIGRKIGPDANPADPARAARAIDQEVDTICERMSTALQELEDYRGAPGEVDAQAVA